jgi:hypothetical protein
VYKVNIDRYCTYHKQNWQFRVFFSFSLFFPDGTPPLLLPCSQAILEVMPELPEVEGVRFRLEAICKGKNIRAIQTVRSTH